MRRDLAELFEVRSAEPLPASPATVIEALGSLLTERRRERIDAVVARRTRSAVVVLDGLFDPHNASAVLRSADAFGVQEVHVIEHADPLLISTRVAKGAENWLDLIRYSRAESCVQALRQRGFCIFVADAAGDLGLDEVAKVERAAVVFGNEHLGVSSELRAAADNTFAVAMRGFVESLNVSVAAALTLHALTAHRQSELSEVERDELRARFMMLSVPRARQVLAELLHRRDAVV